MLGRGSIIDPPRRHLIQAVDGEEEKGSEAAGDALLDA